MIWGVDPGVRKVAVVGIDWHEHIVTKNIEVRKAHRAMELGALSLALNKVLESDPNPILFCEEPVVAGARNIRTSLQIAQTVGVVLASTARSYLVPVSTWKIETVGKGNADKSAVMDWIRQDYPGYFAACDGNQDIADAAAIAIYGRGIVLRSPVDPGSRSHL